MKTAAIAFVLLFASATALAQPANAPDLCVAARMLTRSVTFSCSRLSPKVPWRAVSAALRR